MAWILSDKDIITTLMTVVSFLFSVYALWVVQFNRGRVKMTRPTMLCLKRDPNGAPKIFLRTLLFATGSKGRVIENMFLKVHQQYGTYTFDYWGHTEESGKLTLGSGLFVGVTGIACNHHFNPRDEAGNFLFVDGEYRVEIFATVVGRHSSEKLKELTFTVDSSQAAELIQIPARELHLFWNADMCTYEGHVIERDDNRRNLWVI